MNFSLFTKRKSKPYEDNQEEYKRVAQGYLLQSNRLIDIVKQASDEVAKTQVVQNHQKEQVSEAVVIIKQLQKSIHSLASKKDEYNKHIINTKYCIRLLRPYIKELQNITSDVDNLIYGEKHEQKH